MVKWVSAGYIGSQLLCGKTFIHSSTVGNLSRFSGTPNLLGMAVSRKVHKPFKVINALQHHGRAHYVRMPLTTERVSTSPGNSLINCPYGELQ
jgi:hypothetical protein